MPGIGLSFIVVLSLSLTIFSPASALTPDHIRALSGHLSGPVPAEVLEVVDGDTLKVRAFIWLNQAVETKVRLRGINAPEVRSSVCEPERRLGEAAAAYLTRAVEGKLVTLHDISSGKWAGRIIATLRDAQGREVGQAMMEQGLVVAYDGRSRRGDWCSGSYQAP